MFKISKALSVRRVWPQVRATLTPQRNRLQLKRIKVMFTCHRFLKFLITITGSMKVCYRTFWKDTSWIIFMDRKYRPNQNWVALIWTSRSTQIPWATWLIPKSWPSSRSSRCCRSSVRIGNTWKKEWTSGLPTSAKIFLPPLRRKQNAHWLNLVWGSSTGPVSKGFGRTCTRSLKSPAIKRKELTSHPQLLSKRW